MKKIILTTALSTALMSSSAFALNTDSTELDVSATVAEECSIGDAAAVSFVLAINENAGEDALEMAQASQAEDQDIYVSCNFGTTISVASANDGLFNAAGQDAADNDPDDFTNKIEYRVALTSSDGSYDPIDFRTRTTVTPSVLAGGAFHDLSTLEVRIDFDDQRGKRPVSGLYEDTATISLGAI